MFSVASFPNHPCHLSSQSVTMLGWGGGGGGGGGGEYGNARGFYALSAWNNSFECGRCLYRLSIENMVQWYRLNLLQYKKSVYVGIHLHYITLMYLHLRARQ